MSNCCVRALVTGKVQGVGYRRATQDQALQHSITGYAKNLVDGRVEVLMCGHPDAVKQMGEWLWQGPAAAHVTHVALDVLKDCSVPNHFSAH